MEEKTIKEFFQRAGKEAVEHLGAGTRVLITAGNASHTLILTEERELKVGKEGGDIEIRDSEQTMDNLFSSSTMEEYSVKMISYIIERKGPEVKILMDRTLENAGKFERDYYYFLRKMVLIK